MTYFLINPAHKKRGRKAKAKKSRKRRVALKRKANGQFVKRAKSARRRVRRTRRQTQQGGAMAKRRRRRVRHSATRRRRRRSVIVLRSNPRRRRRRSVVSHRRRRYRRNPGLGGGVVSTVKQGIKDGALVLVGQAAQGRASAIAGRFVPIGGVAGEAVTGLGSAVLVTMAARKFAPNAARMIAAGAFSNAVKRIVAAVSPGVAGLLGDADYMAPPMEYYDAQPALGAYPGGGLGDGGMGAYPGGGLGEVDEFGTQYLS